MMDAVMALCHFCEQHGPSVMFTCEKVNMNKPGLNFDRLSNCGSEPFVEPSYSSSVADTDISSMGSQESLASNLTISSKGTVVKKADLCQACRSLPEGEHGYISHDEEAGVNYVSMQQPNSPDIYRLVRQACVRSLSCEVCPGREGPIMFGDEQDGYVISYTFFVNDNTARGLRRWYSIICIMTDRVFLIQSWPFLVGCIGRVIENLQQGANDSFNGGAPNTSQICNRAKARRPNAITPRNFRQQRGDSSNARALVDLTGNKNLYKYIHTAFTWIMRASGKRLQEHVVHGSLTDEDIVKAEVQARSIRSDSTASNDDETAAIDKELNHLSLRASTPPEINEPGLSTVFQSLRQMRDVLQPPLFKAIAWHLIIGNQVIWRGKDQELITSALHILKEILPVGCIKMLTNSDTYVNSYKANLLGLKEKVSIPNHVANTELHIVIDVVPKTSAAQKLTQFYPSLFDMPQSALNSIEFRMASGCVIPDKGPTMLNKLEIALANDRLSEEVVHHCLICLKQEWINKVKVLYKFTKIDNRDKEDTTKLLHNCLNCSEEDVRLLKFWMTGLSARFKEDLRQSALLHS